MRNQYSDLLKRAISYRQRMNMTQMEVSEELGITQGQFSKMEQGKTIYPHKVLCGLYAMKWDMDHIITGKEYGCTISEVCGMLEEEKKEDRQELIKLVTWAISQGIRKNSLYINKEVQFEIRLLIQYALDINNNTLLYAIRNVSGFSQTVMSEKLGVNIKKYRMLERNVINPDAELLLRIYEETGCRPSLFFVPEKVEENIISYLWQMIDDDVRKEIISLISVGVSVMKS